MKVKATNFPGMSGILKNNDVQYILTETSMALEHLIVLYCNLAYRSVLGTVYS